MAKAPKKGLDLILAMILVYSLMIVHGWIRTRVAAFEVVWITPIWIDSLFAVVGVWMMTINFKRFWMCLSILITVQFILNTLGMAVPELSGMTDILTAPIKGLVDSLFGYMKSVKGVPTL